VRYESDARGQVSSVTDPLGSVVSFEYDTRGNLTTLTDERGSVTTFTYDELYRPVSRRDPLGQTVVVTYDAAGNVAERLDRLGRRTTYAYDALNRPSRVAYPDAAVTYGYDDAGRATLVNDTQSSPVEWAYDDADRLLAETTPAGVVRYAYNAAGQRTSMTAADRPAVAYAYDAAGRLQTIRQGQETFTFTYDALSRLAGLQRPNGVRTAYGYDAVSRLERLTHHDGQNQSLEDFRYSYNPDSEIERITSLAAAQALPAAKQFGAADAANRVTQLDQAGYTFDAEGQTTSKTDAQGTTHYGWDARGRLTQATLPGGQTVGYGYDALNRRVSRTAGGVTTSFLYDGEDVVRDREGGGGFTDYLNGAGLDNKLRQTSAATGPLYFHQDHLGSTAFLTNAGGAGVESQQYEAFGASAGSALTRYGYTGRERDPSTGLLYYRARWYDPHQGRFISEDPIGVAGGTNFYAYVNNTPVNLNDPRGLIAPLVFAGLILGGGGAVAGVATVFFTGGGTWQEYVAAGAGGAVGGLTLLTEPILGPIGSGVAAGAAAGAVENATKQLLNNNGFNLCEFAVATGSGAVVGAIPFPKIPGLNSGRNSFEAIFNSTWTKLKNGTISNVSGKTYAKSFASQVIPDTGAGILGTGLEGLLDNLCGCPKN
jgi:RHS repeat-associated protein